MWEGEYPVCTENDVESAWLLLNGTFKTPRPFAEYHTRGVFTEEFYEFQRNKLKSLKRDMERARLLPGLADAIDAADSQIATITEQKTTADGKKSELVEKYYKSGKKEDE